MHIQLLALLLHFGVHVPLIRLTFSHIFRSFCCLWAAIFAYAVFRKCMPQWTSNLDAIFLDFGRLLAPIGCPLAPSRSPKCLPKHPKIESKSDLAANCNSAPLFSPFRLQLAPLLAPFSCLLPPFSDHFDIIFRSPCVIASYTFFRFGVQVFA